MTRTFLYLRHLRPYDYQAVRLERVPPEIVLVMLLRRIEGVKPLDLCHYRFLKILLDFLYVVQHSLLLFRALVKDNRPVLAPNIGTLPAGRGRIVHREEDLEQDIQ